MTRPLRIYSQIWALSAGPNGYCFEAPRPYVLRHGARTLGTVSFLLFLASRHLMNIFGRGLRMRLPPQPHLLSKNGFDFDTDITSPENQSRWVRLHRRCGSVTSRGGEAAVLRQPLLYDQLSNCRRAGHRQQNRPRAYASTYHQFLKECIPLLDFALNSNKVEELAQ